MNKYDLAAYLANLSFIFDHHERLGTTKNPKLVKEFHDRHEELVKILEREQDK